MGQIRENVKKNLGYYLSLQGISQKELAEKLGVSQSAVTNWIKGKNSPDIESVAQICQALRISVSDLFGAGDMEMTIHERSLLQLYRDLCPELQEYLMNLVLETCALQERCQKDRSSWENLSGEAASSEQ